MPRNSSMIAMWSLGQKMKCGAWRQNQYNTIKNKIILKIKKMNSTIKNVANRAVCMNHRWFNR
jgi:hypothetical protein